MEEGTEYWNLAWFNEKIERVKGSNWLYRFLCFFLGRKRLTYKQMFLILYGLNKRRLGDKNSERLAIARILDIYKDLHDNKLPEGV